MPTTTAHDARVCSACAALLPASSFPYRQGRPTTICRGCLAARKRHRLARRRGRVTRDWAAAVGQSKSRARAQAAILAAVRALGGPQGFAEEIHRQLAAAPPGSPAPIRLLRALLDCLPGGRVPV